MQAKEQWRAINSTSGVLRLLTIDHRPAVIKPSIVEKLQRQSDAHQGAVRLAETFKRRYVTADKVKIIDGPFKSHVGEVMDMYSKEGREKYLLDIIGALGPIWVDENDLAQ